MKKDEQIFYPTLSLYVTWQKIRKKVADMKKDLKTETIGYKK